MHSAKIVIVLGLLSVGRVTAAAPETVAGSVFTETRTFVVVTRPSEPRRTTSTTNAFFLNADSTFVCFFGGYPANVGRWSYQKHSPDLASLILDGVEQRLAVFDRKLDFTTNSFADSGSGVVSSSFSITPISGLSRVANVSSRSFIRAGDSATAGFVVRGDGAIVLVRAVGPGLAGFGVADPLRTPRLQVFGAGIQIASVGAWSSGNAEAIEQVTRFAAAVGAFPFRQGSNDAAIALSLPAGAYTASVSSMDSGDSGQVLVEVYVLP